MLLPAALVLINVAGSRLGALDRGLSRTRGERFDDARVNEAAQAMLRDDTTALRTALARGGIDFAARNGRGRTLLGTAVERASDWNTPTGAFESLRLVLEAGARAGHPPMPNVIEAEPTPRDPDAHLLTYWLLGRSPDAAVRVLDLLLAHGAERNPVDARGQPALFSTQITLPFLHTLARHGADLTVLDTTRTDRPKWSAPMTAALFGKWDQVTYYLDQGLDPTYVAPDGNSLASIVDAKVREGTNDTALATVQRRLGVARSTGTR